MQYSNTWPRPIRAIQNGSATCQCPCRDRPQRLPAAHWAELAPLRPLPDGSRDPDLPRIFQRRGSVVPLGPLVQHSGERGLDTLEVSVCFDGEGRAEGILYEDAGDGWGFERGEYR